MFIELQKLTGAGASEIRPVTLAVTHILAVAATKSEDLTKITMCGGGEYLVIGEYATILARLRHVTEKLLSPA